MPYSTLDPSDETTVFASKEAPLLALKLWPNRSLSRTGSFYLLLVVWFLMTIPMLALLAKENILTLNDFAELATFELIDKEEGILRSLDIEEELANNMIMEARKNWFD